MSCPKTRCLSFKNNDYFDETKANEFITHFIPLAFYICKEWVKSRNINCGMATAKSVALEACFKVYMLEENENSKAVSYNHQKGRIRLYCKYYLFNELTTQGFFRSSGQKFFPNGFVPIEWLENHITNEINSIDDIDFRQIESLLRLIGNEFENKILDLYLLGYNYVEIAEKLLTTKSCISKRMSFLIKNMTERPKSLYSKCLNCGERYISRNKASNFCSKKCERKITSHQYYLKKKKERELNDQR
jgi:hypothetical protein